MLGERSRDAGEVNVARTRTSTSNFSNIRVGSSRADQSVCMAESVGDSNPRGNAIVTCR
jgi:hypothetical protein